MEFDEEPKDKRCNK